MVSSVLLTLLSYLLLYRVPCCGEQCVVDAESHAVVSSVLLMLLSYLLLYRAHTVVSSVLLMLLTYLLLAYCHFYNKCILVK